MWPFKKKERKPTPSTSTRSSRQTPSYPSTYDYSTPSTYYGSSDSGSSSSCSSGGDSGGGGCD